MFVNFENVTNRFLHNPQESCLYVRFDEWVIVRRAVRWVLPLSSRMGERVALKRCKRLARVPLSESGVMLRVTLSDRTVKAGLLCRLQIDLMLF